MSRALLLRSRRAGATVLAGVLALGLAAHAGAKPVAVLIPGGPPQPSVTAPQLSASPGAGWSCSHARCRYVKTDGTAWSACFTGYAPTHNAWRPTRYCH